MLAQQGYETMEQYSYAGYAPTTRQELEHISSTIHERIINIRDSIIEIGDMLTKARGLVKHGEWGDWLQANFQWSESTARNYMNVVSTFGKSATVADLANINTSALYMLALPSTPGEAREQALAESRGGEQVGKARAKEIIEEHKHPSVGVVWAGDETEDETEDETVQEQDEQHTCYCGQKARHRVDGVWYCDHHVPVRACPTCGRPTMAEGECHTCANHATAQFCEYTIYKRGNVFVVAKDGHEIRLQTRGHAERLINGCYTATAPASFDKDIDQAAAWDFKLKTQPTETWAAQEEARAYIESIDAEMKEQELSPDIVYYKILCFGSELAWHAKNALRALGKEFESLEYMQHVPDSEEMKAVVEEYFDVLFGDIASRALFSGDES
jgi:hypothetical protein